MQTTKGKANLCVSLAYNNTCIQMVTSFPNTSTILPHMWAKDYFISYSAIMKVTGLHSFEPCYDLAEGAKYL